MQGPPRRELRLCGSNRTLPQGRLPPRRMTWSTPSRSFSLVADRGAREAVDWRQGYGDSVVPVHGSGGAGVRRSAQFPRPDSAVMHPIPRWAVPPLRTGCHRVVPDPVSREYIDLGLRTVQHSEESKSKGQTSRERGAQSYGTLRVGRAAEIAIAVAILPAAPLLGAERDMCEQWGGESSCWRSPPRNRPGAPSRAWFWVGRPHGSTMAATDSRPGRNASPPSDQPAAFL